MRESPDGSKDEDLRLMQIAIEQAKLGELMPGAGEVGCVIALPGGLLVKAHNEAKLRCDPTAHAEIVAIRKATATLQTTELRGCTLYCTLQPCSMCTAACIWAKVGRIVFGATRDDVHSMYFDAKHLNAVDLVNDAYRDDIQIVGGVLSQECSRFYYKPKDRPPLEEQSNI